MADSMGAMNIDLWFLRSLVSRVLSYAELRAYFLSSSEYLLTATMNKSPGPLAVPVPGLASLTRSAGENTFVPSVKLKSFTPYDATMVGAGCCRVGSRGT